MRLLSNARKKARNQVSSNEVSGGPLVLEEMDRAQRYWIISARRDLEDWQNRFSDLASFVKEGVLRVGGGLRHAPLIYEEIHPILLPASHPISKLIIREVHTQVYVVDQKEPCRKVAAVLDNSWSKIVQYAESFASHHTVPCKLDETEQGGPGEHCSPAQLFAPFVWRL